MYLVTLSDNKNNKGWPIKLFAQRDLAFRYVVTNKEFSVVGQWEQIHVGIGSGDLTFRIECVDIYDRNSFWFLVTYMEIENE